MTVEDTGYNIATKVAGKHKGVLILALMVGLVVVTLLGGYTIMIGGIRVSIENEGQEGGVPVLRAEFEAYKAANAKRNTAIDGNHVRFIEKQHGKIVKDPGDVHLFEVDLRFAVDFVWPALPEALKTPTLTEKYQIVEDAYHSTLNPSA